MRGAAVGASSARRTRAALLLVPFAVGAAWALVLAQPAAGPSPLEPAAWRRAWTFLSRLLGRGLAEEPAFARPEVWARMADLALGTLAMSVTGAALATLAALLTVPLAARAREEPARGALRGPVRACYVLARSVPEIVWALLLVLVSGPGPLAAALALGVHNAGVLGRLFTDVVEDVDPRPGRALATAGAGRVEAFWYGTFPQILPQVLTFSLYRWEVIVRTTVVVEAVTGSGMGAALRLALSGRAFTTVTVILALYVALVLLVDVLSGALRTLARA